MIKLNGKVVENKYFPDGTQLIKVDNDEFIADFDPHSNFYIEWKYENDAELFKVYCLKRYIDERFHGREKCDLVMYYIPNARQDRVKRLEDVFTLKYFSEIINALKFNTVTVLDPHSPVSEALLNNLEVLNLENIFKVVVGNLGLKDDEFVIYYPDNGAYKKYSDYLKYPSIYGVKHRNWEDGKITGVDVMTNGLDISGKTVIVVDDIISYGGSIYYSLPVLKKFNVGKIYAIASHVEDSILKGELIKSPDIEKIFTSNSLLDFDKVNASEYKDKITCFNQIQFNVNTPLN